MYTRGRVRLLPWESGQIGRGISSCGSTLTNFDRLAQYIALRAAQSEMLGIPFGGKAERLVENWMEKPPCSTDDTARHDVC